jgi:hypothetical protein
MSAVLKVWIAGMGAYALGRRLSITHLPSVLAGTTYAYSIFNIFWLNHPHTNVTIFFPWLLLLAEHITQSPSPSAMALLGLTVGTQLLGGHVEIAFQIAFAVTVFFLFRLIDGYRRDTRALFLRLRIFVGGYTLGFFLAGVLMIPFLEFLSQSATWHVRSEQNPFFLMPVVSVSLFLPDFFIQKSWFSTLGIYHAVSLYVGICPLILAVVALAGQPRKAWVFFAVLCLFALNVAFGLPPFFPVLVSLPLFKQAPNFYMVIFYILGMSLLGAAGMDLVLGQKGDGALRKRVKRTLVVLGLVLPFLAGWAILLGTKTVSPTLILEGPGRASASPVSDVISQIGSSLTRASLFAGLTLVLVVVALQSRRFKRFKTLPGVLILGVAFVDLFVAGSGWNPVIPCRWANAPVPESVRFLRQDTDLFRVAGFEPVMPPNLATLAGLQDIRGYDVPVDERYHLFFQKALRGKTSWWIYEFPKLETAAMPFLSLLNVKYLLSLDPLPTPLTLVYDNEIKIYQNPEAFPRAFLVHQVETVRDGPEALARVLTLGRNLKQIAVLEAPAGSFPSMNIAEKGGGTGDRVQIMAYSSRHVEIEVEAASSGLLVLSDTYFPGWKAEVDGKRTPILLTDYLLRGIVVDPGSHRVRFSYRPDSFYIGLGLTIISGAVILWLLKRRKR